MKCYLILLLAFALLSPSSASLAPPTVEELKRDVEQKEQDLREARLALTVAKIRLALAEGKPASVVADCRTVLRDYEGQLKRVEDLLAKGRLCSEEPLCEASGRVAVARSWLADAEGKRADSLMQLPKAIEYYEWRTKWIESLRKFQAIQESEANTLLKQTRLDLEWARNRLVALRALNP